MDIRKTRNYSFYVRDNVEVRCYPVKIALTLNTYEFKYNTDALICFASNQDILPKLYDVYHLDTFLQNGFQAVAGMKRGYVGIDKSDGLTNDTIGKLYDNSINSFKHNYDGANLIWGTKILHDGCIEMIPGYAKGVDMIHNYFVFRYLYHNLYSEGCGRRREISIILEKRFQHLESCGVLRYEISRHDFHTKFDFKFINEITTYIINIGDE